MERKLEVKRSNIYLADLGSDGKLGSEQKGTRPVIVLQNDIGNKYSPTVIVAIITSKLNKRNLPTQTLLPKGCGNILQDSLVLTEQTLTIDKSRLIKYIGTVDSNIMNYIDKAVAVSLELVKFESREIKTAKAMANDIYSLDKFISMWLSKKDNFNEISEFILEREMKIRDLNKFCEKHNLNYKEYYKVTGREEIEKYRMVG